VPPEPALSRAVRFAFTLVAPDAPARVDIGRGAPPVMVRPGRGLRVETTFEGDTRTLPVYRPPRPLKLTTRSKKNSDGVFGEVDDEVLHGLASGKELIVGLRGASELAVDELSPLLDQARRTGHPLIIVILPDERSA
jgi:hypothetical protein